MIDMAVVPPQCSELPTDQWYNCIGDLNTLADVNPGPADEQCTSHRHPRRVNAQAQRRPELNIRASMSCATCFAAATERFPSYAKDLRQSGSNSYFAPVE